MTAANPFADPASVAGYGDGPPRLVPGFADMQRMAAILLAEAAPPEGQILILGAGGGLELRAFASAHPGWRLTGVDPSTAMLDIARQTLGPLADRVQLVCGTVDDAPTGPFDGATCILTMPFIGPDDRLDAIWMARFAAFAGLSGISFPPDKREEMLARLTILSPDTEEDLLRQAGFRDVSPFYAALAFRGWVATA